MHKQPQVQPVPGKNRYMLLKDYFVLVNGRVIAVPAGFEFDGASIPRFAWSIVGTPFAPKTLRAALVHDWLYFSHECSRKEADLYFKVLLKQACVGACKRSLMHMAVRAGGWKSWAWDDDDLKQSFSLEFKLQGKLNKGFFKIPNILT